MLRSCLIREFTAFLEFTLHIFIHSSITSDSTCQLTLLLPFGPSFLFLLLLPFSLTHFPSQRDQALEVRAKFDSPEGDHVMLLNVFRMYKAAKGNKVHAVAQWPFSYSSCTVLAGTN